jgi:hypothetical protein
MGVLSGIRGDSFDNNGSKKEGDVVQPRVTVTLEEILDKFNAPETIDYLSLDVEGAESLVIQAPLLGRYHFNVITIERPKPDLCELLVSDGYVKAAKHEVAWGDTIWLHQSMVDELDLAGADVKVSKEERTQA